METNKLNVLGSEYTIRFADENSDPYIKKCDGYTDKTSHTIVISEKTPECELDDFEAYQKKVLRHEIIHAFLFESGFDCCCWEHEGGHDETYVDWMAVQFPKLLAAFKEAGAL